MSTSTDTATAQAGGTHSGQWGLAAILLGSLVLILFPLLLMLGGGLLLGVYEDDFNQSRDIDLAVTGGYVVCGAFVGLALFSLLCALAGLGAGKRCGQPLGLSIAGLVVSLGAVVFAVLLLLGMLRAADWTRQLQHLRDEKGIRKPPPTMFH